MAWYRTKTMFDLGILNESNRGRANRFYNAFLCQPFQPPDGGIPNVGTHSTDGQLGVRRPS